MIWVAITAVLLAYVIYQAFTTWYKSPGKITHPEVKTQYLPIEKIQEILNANTKESVFKKEAFLLQISNEFFYLAEEKQAIVLDAILTNQEAKSSLLDQLCVVKGRMLIDNTSNPAQKKQIFEALWSDEKLKKKFLDRVRIYSSKDWHKYYAPFQDMILEAILKDQDRKQVFLESIIFNFWDYIQKYWPNQKEKIFQAME